MVLYSMETVQKLAVSVEARRFFIPLDSPSSFRLLSDTHTEPCHLRELFSAAANFPLLLELDEESNYFNGIEEILPTKAALKAEVRYDKAVRLRLKCVKLSRV